MDKAQNAVDVFNLRANDYAEKFMDTSLYHDTFNLYCAQLKNGASLLEIACGPGNITKYLLGKRPDLKILGTDLAPNMTALAQKNNPTAEFCLLDSRKISELKKKFDGIMCGFGFPYLSKEEAIKFITDSKTVLKEKGVLYISTMEDNYSKSGIHTSSKGDRMFLHYHEAAYLTEALRKNDFNILNVQRKIYEDGNGSEVRDLIIIAVSI